MTEQEETRPPLPLFSADTARVKARAAEDAWNSRDPARVALAYTEDNIWRNRSEFLIGRKSIVEFLTRKWSGELDYRLIKEVWAHGDDRIAVRFAYEWLPELCPLTSPVFRGRSSSYRAQRSTHQQTTRFTSVEKHWAGRVLPGASTGRNF